MLIVSIYIKRSLNLIFLLLIVFVLSESCNRAKKKTKHVIEKTELERIREAGVLRAVVDYNSTDYFVYRGKPMGFSYELLKELCNELRVKPEITVNNDFGVTFNELKDNRFDLIAKNLAITLERKEDVDFTMPLYQTKQVLVQREVGLNTPDSLYIYSVLQLAEKDVYVPKNTSYHKRLINLSEEIGEHINIITDSVFSTEELIGKVANNEINYTVCDKNVARLNKTYYPNIDVSLDVSFPQNIAWAIPQGKDVWKEYINNWITEFRKTKKYAVLYHRYFESPRIVNRLNSGWHSISGGKISNFDMIIKQLAKENNWDWRLIASVIYQESRFRPEIESWAGAYGLMQVMPETAQALGIEDYMDPAQNIKAGISMLNWLDRQLAESVPDSSQRIKFVLAAYNVGLGHVKDAQRLAEKYGKNSQIWDGNTDYFLLHKSSEKYFKDPVVQWGYCRGEQPFNYVNKVTQNYMHYLNVIPES